MLSDQAMLLPPQYTTLSITWRSHSQPAASAISVVGWKTGRLPPELYQHVIEKLVKAHWHQELHRLAQGSQAILGFPKSCTIICNGP